MFTRIWSSIATLGFLLGVLLIAVVMTQPRLAAAQEAPFCDASAGHAWEIRRYVTQSVTLFSTDGERLTAVPASQLRDVEGVVECENNLTYVHMETPFGPRLVQRRNLLLGGGIGEACRCPDPSRPRDFASNADRNASSSGVGEGGICNADLPCR